MEKRPISAERNLIIDIHTHAEGHFDSKDLDAGAKDWVERQLVPRHPYMAPETVRDYYFNFSPQRYLQEYDDAGVDKIVILSLSADRNKYYYENFVKRYPDRFLAFAGVQPFDEFKRFRKKALEELEVAVKEFGFKGVKLAPPYEYYSGDAPQLYPLYEKCAELGVAVTLHQAATPFITAGALEYGSPACLERPADDFPAVNFIAAHMGYPWTEELLALMDKRTNVWTDVSHLCVRRFMLAWYLTMAKEYQVLDRVMFGTDSTCRPPKRYLDWFKVTLNQVCEKTGWPAFSKEEIDGILGENAARLLRLK